MTASNDKALTPRTVTQRDVAEYCGVSQMAVSLALRGDPGVSADTAARIREAAISLGYDPAAQSDARRLALRKHGLEVKNHVIGLLFPAIVFRDSYHSEIYGGIVQAISSTGSGLLSAFMGGIGDPAQYRLPASFNRGEVDAVIALLASDALHPLVAQLRAMPGFRDRPIISMVWPTDSGSNIMPDYAHGAYCATRHLLELGHRHVLHFGHADDYRYLWGYPQEQRLLGVRRALAEAGVNPETHLESYPLPSGWMNPATLDAPDGDNARALVAHLRARPHITALLGWNDAVAIRAIRALADAGYRTPEDYSVVGYDDTDPLRGDHGENTLTSVRMPLSDIGAEAVRVAFDRTTGDLAEDVTRILPTELVTRGTTGPASLNSGLRRG